MKSVQSTQVSQPAQTWTTSTLHCKMQET